MNGKKASRRTVLRLAGLGVLGGVAGCSQPQSGDTDPEGDSPTETVTPTRTAVDVTVEIVASFPAQTDGSTEQRQETLLSKADFASVSPPQEGGEARQPYVPVTLTETGAENFTSALREYSFTSDAGINACEYSSSPDDPGYCLHTVIDGDIVFSASMGPSLAQVIESGEFSQEPTFILQTSNMSQARKIASALGTDE